MNGLKLSAENVGMDRSCTDAILKLISLLLEPGAFPGIEQSFAEHGLILVCCYMLERADCTSHLARGVLKIFRRLCSTEAIIPVFVNSAALSSIRGLLLKLKENSQRVIISCLVFCKQLCALGGRYGATSCIHAGLLQVSILQSLNNVLLILSRLFLLRLQ